MKTLLETRGRVSDPITFEILDSKGLFLSRWAGAVNDGDLLRCYGGLFGMEEWRPGLNELLDAREADMSGVTASGMRALSRLVEDHFKGLDLEFRTAVVAPDDLPFGMARMYEVLSDQSSEAVRVFRDPRAAVAWLGVEMDLLD